MSLCVVSGATSSFDFVMRKGDTAPILSATLKTDAGVVVDISGATVTFSMRSQANGAMLVTAASATIVSGPAGTVAYAWAAPDVAVAGIMEAMFTVTFSNGKIETFPDNRFLLGNLLPGIT